MLGLFLALSLAGPWACLAIDPMSIGLRAVCFLACLLSLLPALVLLLGRSKRAARLFLVYASAAGLLISAELGFMFVTQPQSVGYSLGARRWFQKHWQPISQFGRRDRVFSEADLARPQIVVLGDSFAAGHGCADYEDRFSNVLETALGGGWTVINISENGFDTPDQLTELQKHSADPRFQPRVLVWSYFGNDLFKAAVRMGHGSARFEPYLDLPPGIDAVVRNSYLANFAYWAVPRGDLDDWWERLDQAYRDPQVLAAHAEELRALATWCQERKIAILPLIFPYLHDLERSEVYRSWVTQRFTDLGLEPVDVQALVSDLPIRERIAGVNDVHPSVEVHRRVGEAIAKALREQGLL